MATTGIINGQLVGLYVDGSLIAGATEHSLSYSHSVRDTTTKDSADGEAESLEGLKDGSISLSGLAAYDPVFGNEELFATLKARTKVTLVFTTNVVGDPFKQCEAHCTSFEESYSNQESGTYSAEFQKTGVWTTGTET